MDDLISREAAIEAIDKRVDEGYENIKMLATFPQRPWFDGMTHAQSILVNLPSAQPERKKGKWIVTSLFIKCSECGEAFMLMPQNYCPNCGADMRGEEDD